MWGRFNRDMYSLLEEVVYGKTVYDLGAGDLSQTRVLLAAGAHDVVAVDKKFPRGAEGADSPRVRLVEATFELADPPPTIEVSLLSWPANHRMSGLLRLLRRSEVVVYLGCNFGGMACGWPELFYYFSERRLLGYVDSPVNSMIVLGETLDSPREMVPEELAGVSKEIMYRS